MTGLVFVERCWSSGVARVTDKLEVNEIDESKFGKRKYNVGRLVEGQGFRWRVSGESSVSWFLLSNETAKSCLPKDRILPGTTIISDCWKAYSCLEQEGYLYGRRRKLTRLRLCHTTLTAHLHRLRLSHTARGGGDYRTLLTTVSALPLSPCCTPLSTPGPERYHLPTLLAAASVHPSR